MIQLKKLREEIDVILVFAKLLNESKSIEKKASYFNLKMDKWKVHSITSIKLKELTRRYRGGK